MADSKRVVYIIDDDPSVLRGFKRLMAAYGYDACLFASAAEFLAAVGVKPRGGHALIRGRPGPDSCLIIDIAMPEMDGLQLQEELARKSCQAPMIFITALDDPDIQARVMRAGAAAFFQKPVDASALLDAVKRAMTTETRTAECGTRK